MQRWCGFFALLATSMVAAQDASTTTTPKPGANTRFGPGAFPGGGGGFGNPGLVNPGFQQGGAFGNPGLVNPGFQQGGFGNPGLVNPGFQQGGVFGNPGLVNPGFHQGGGFVNPGVHQAGFVNPQQPFVSPLRPDCKFYKRDAFGNWVCDVDQKPFECPPLRPECPRFGPFAPLPPQQCFNDNDCFNADKCCPDICFDHLICKGPE